MNTLPQKLLKQLYFVYGEKAKNIIPDLSKLLAEYSYLKRPRFSLTEKDILLICYGDQIIEKKRLALDVLQDFLQKYLRNHINMLHILPFYPYSSDDGFSVIDYKKVREELGNWHAVKSLAKHFQLMFDAVLNHISAQSEWMTKYLEGILQFQNFFIECSPDTNLEKVIRAREHPLLTPFIDKDKKKRYLWTTFSEDQVDLNFTDPKVFVAAIDILLFYVANGASLIRLDAIGFLWKELGTTCIHLPQTHAIIKMFRYILDIVAPGTILITETNVPHRENISYFGENGNEAQLVYQFSLPPLVAHAILRENADYLSRWAANLEFCGENTTFFNFCASHDGVGLRPAMDILPAVEIQFLVDQTIEHGGLVSYRNVKGKRSPYELNINYCDLLVQKDDAESIVIAKMLLSQAILLAMPGLPGIYFHSLFGSRNDYLGVEHTGRPRSINREKLEREKLEQELEQDGFRRRYLQKYLHLIEIRRNCPCFNPYVSFTFPVVSSGIFAVERRIKTEKLLALHNVTGQKQQITIKGQWLEIIYEQKIIDKIEIQPYQALWVIQKI